MREHHNAPWEPPTSFPVSAAVVVSELWEAEAKAVAAAPSSTDKVAAVRAFDERLLRATLYPYESGFATTCVTVTPNPSSKDTRKGDVMRSAVALAKLAAEFVAYHGRSSSMAGVHPRVTDVALAKALTDSCQEVLARVPDEKLDGERSLRDILVQACDPTLSDDITAADWELATSCAGALLHACAVAWTVGPDAQREDATMAAVRLASLRDAVQLHRGAGCFVKCLLPMAVVARIMYHNSASSRSAGAQLWNARGGLLLECSVRFLTLPQHGGYDELAAYSAKTFWGLDRDRAREVAAWVNGGCRAAAPELPSGTLGPIVVNEALIGVAAMERLKMFGSSGSPTRRAVQAMVGMPTPMMYGNPAIHSFASSTNPLGPRPARDQVPRPVVVAAPQNQQSTLASVVRVGLPPSQAAEAAGQKSPAADRSPDAAGAGESERKLHSATPPAGEHPPSLGQSTTSLPPPSAPVPVSAASADRDETDDPAGLQALLEETAQFDPGMMLAFALTAITESDNVTVATAKRAVEAVECAVDGDRKEVDAMVERKPRVALREYLAVCGAAISPKDDTHREHVRLATERVLAREHGTAHSSILARQSQSALAGVSRGLTSSSAVATAPAFSPAGGVGPSQRPQHASMMAASSGRPHYSAGEAGAYRQQVAVGGSPTAPGAGMVGTPNANGAQVPGQGHHRAHRGTRGHRRAVHGNGRRQDGSSGGGGGGGGGGEEGFAGGWSVSGSNTAIW